MREFSSCSCLTALPGPAWVLLSKTFKPFRPTQYACGWVIGVECLVLVSSLIVTLLPCPRTVAITGKPCIYKMPKVLHLRCFLHMPNEPCIPVGHVAHSQRDIHGVRISSRIKTLVNTSNMTKFILLPALIILALGCNIIHALRCYDYDDKDCKVGEDCTKKERTKILECSDDDCGVSTCDICRTSVNRELSWSSLYTHYIGANLSF